jgi:heme exporter protein A
MKSNSLELNALVVARDGAALTPPIDLRLESGQMLLLRGANGSGKSTFLKILAGLLPVEKGAIRLTYANGGRPPTLYLGHKRGFTPSMSVYDNVAFWAKASGFPELIPAALHYFDLTDVAGAILATLSAGWQQRVALTRLITVQSSLWLLDEPTANLDAEGNGLLQSLIESRLAQGGMIVMATHAHIEGPAVKELHLSELTNHLKAA